ncbi:MAG: hypothetical protein AAF791_05010 [Bacteroidota bacterium]
MRSLPLLLAMLVLPASAMTTTATVTPSASGNGCEWTVTGAVRVNHAMPELEGAIGEFSDLAGVKVKVSAALRLSSVGGGVWGTYDKWAEVTTNSRGEFTVRHTPTLSSCDGVRRFRVKVKFQSDDLELRHGNATSSLNKVKWYTIVDQDGTQTDHTVDLGTKTFDWQHAHDLGEMEARGHAEAWVVYTALLDQLESYGSGYTFTEPLKVKFPHNSALAGDGVEASYANPFTNVVYIFRANDCPENRLVPAEGACESHLTVNALLHEAMHIWAYQHSTGEEDLALNLLTSGSTHCFEPTYIAFHEGFAEFAAERLAKILFGIDAPLPVTRDAMQDGFTCEGSTNRLTSIGQVEDHDYGWIASLRTLIKGRLQSWTYEGSATSRTFRSSTNAITEHGELTVVGACDSPQIVFKDVLTTFLAHPADGYPAPLAKGDMNLEDFVDRLTDIHDLGNDTRDALLTLMDPAATEQPRDLFCEGNTGPRVLQQPRVRDATERLGRRGRGN